MSRALCLPLLIALTVGPGAARSQSLPDASQILRAAAATELPAGPWGSYARTHLGVQYLASRFPPQSFSFPLVVGQRLDAVVLQPQEGGRARPAAVVLQRRSIGLAPLPASGDDRKPAGAANRRAHVVEADPQGLFTRFAIPFRSAQLAQTTASGTAGASWTAGEATVETWPAYSAGGSSGLMVKVTVSNLSDTPQTWFADLLGGVEGSDPHFAPTDLTILAEPSQGGVTLRHKKAAPIFALAAASDSPIRVCRVGGSYFAQAACVTSRGASGAADPAGLIAVRQTEHKRRRDRRKRGEPAISQETAAPEWGMVRVDEIAVEPHREASLLFSVAVGDDEDGAQQGARELLAAAANGGSIEQARRAHAAVTPHFDDAAISRLFAQTVVNTPFSLLRRVGVATREPAGDPHAGMYNPGEGGLIALGWASLWPEWSAAQANAFFLTTGPTKPAEHPLPVAPTNLFAVWELYQRTHDREVLMRFYPYLQKRYSELVAAGRPGADSWLFAWKRPAAGQTAEFAADYSAYIVRSALIMASIAERLGRVRAETDGYRFDAEQAAKAMSAHFWDAGRGLFRATTEGQADAPVSSSALLPVLAGRSLLTEAQRAALLSTLTGPGCWSDFGVKAAGASQGASEVRPGANWLIWKALLTMGETDTARRLADRICAAYDRAVEESDSCPAALDGRTGAAIGPADSSGAAAALLDIWAAYRRVGGATAGWDADVIESRYDAEKDSLAVVVRTSAGAGPQSIVCVMGRPKASYRCIGAVQGAFEADSLGTITITLPDAAGTRQIEITRTGGGS
jgi:hypothetical protein